MKVLAILVFCSFFTLGPLAAQPDDKDALYIKQLHQHILLNGKCYDNLRILCKKAGGRLAGSSNYLKAVEITNKQLSAAKCDTIYTQECMAIGWERDKEGRAYLKEDSVALSVTTLGNSVGSDELLCGEVVRFTSLEEIKKEADRALTGKIAFLDRPFDVAAVNTFSAYGGAVDQRVYGPGTASDKGAIAALVRSMTSLYNNVPHTGVTVFLEGQRDIPALAISINDADKVAAKLSEGPVEVCVESHSYRIAEVPSFNVVGEIKGAVSPDTIILVGGHLDSWDTGEGAHDDGAGCVQSIEVIQAFKDLGYQPRYTIRCVLFANEESGLAGGKKYAELAKQNGEYHLAAIESDRGGFTPRGFTCDGNSSIFKEKFAALNAFEDVLTNYNLYIKKGGAGADISPLKEQNTLLIGYKPDSQRYFDYHHASNDTFETVNERELKLGAAAMASLVYLIDSQGL